MPEEQDSTPKKKPPLMLILVVAGIMIIEGLGVFLFVSLTGRAPQTAEADLQTGPDLERDSLVEIALVKDDFQNMSTNRVWLWRTELFLKVRKKNEAYVTEQLERRSAEIHEGIARIIRRAQHSHLKEPDLKTIGRQFSAYVHSVFGDDPDGLPRVERVIIATFKGHPVNS